MQAFKTERKPSGHGAGKSTKQYSSGGNVAKKKESSNQKEKTERAEVKRQNSKSRI